VVTAALQEDVHGIAVSSYQGGHNEYFTYMVELLKPTRRRTHPGVRRRRRRDRAGRDPHAAGHGVRIFSPEDGQRMGLQGMIGEMVMRCRPRSDAAMRPPRCRAIQGHTEAAWRHLAQLITAWRTARPTPQLVTTCMPPPSRPARPVLGITGTGGAGKSSLTDELIRRIRLDQGDALRIAVISIDPSRRKSGGALLGDRIRMNAIRPWQTASASTCAAWPRATPAARSAPRCPTCWPPPRWPALIW
jgi:methylmalonyl-CoA mutase